METSFTEEIKRLERRCDKARDRLSHYRGLIKRIESFIHDSGWKLSKVEGELRLELSRFERGIEDGTNRYYLEHLDAEIKCVLSDPCIGTNQLQLSLKE